MPGRVIPPPHQSGPCPAIPTHAVDGDRHRWIGAVNVQAKSLAALDAGSRGIALDFMVGRIGQDPVGLAGPGIFLGDERRGVGKSCTGGFDDEGRQHQH